MKKCCKKYTGAYLIDEYIEQSNTETKIKYDTVDIIYCPICGKLLPIDKQSK